MSIVSSTIRYTCLKQESILYTMVLTDTHFFNGQVRLSSKVLSRESSHVFKDLNFPFNFPFLHNCLQLAFISFLMLWKLECLLYCAVVRLPKAEWILTLNNLNKIITKMLAFIVLCAFLLGIICIPWRRFWYT